MEPPPDYLPLLLATLWIELLIGLLGAPAGRRRRTAAAAISLNLATHPLATLCVSFAGGSYACVELAVIL